MNNKQIKGLADGNENGEALNVKQLKEVENNLNTNTIDLIFLLFHINILHFIMYLGTMLELINNVVRVAFDWGKINSHGNITNFNLYIHVNKSQIKIPRNPLFNESHLKSINIPNNAVRKNIWFWIWMQNDTFYYITSRSSRFNTYKIPELKINV